MQVTVRIFQKGKELLSQLDQSPTSIPAVSHREDIPLILETIYALLWKKKPLICHVSWQKNANIETYHFRVNIPAHLRRRRGKESMLFATGSCLEVLASSPNLLHTVKIMDLDPNQVAGKSKDLWLTRVGTGWNSEEINWIGNGF